MIVPAYGQKPAWRRRDKIGITLVAAVLIALTPCAARSAIRTLRPCAMFAAEPFDREVWDSRFPCNGRSSMADDVVLNVLETGMTRQEVIALLGEPDADPFEYMGGRTIAYEMACWIDCDWLVVRFDESWSLTEAFDFQD